MAFLTAPGLLTLTPRRRSSLSCHRRPRRAAPRRPIPAAMTVAVDDLGLPTELAKLVEAFASVPDPKLRYQQLLFYARQLPPMDPKLKTEENLVRGCQSIVHIHVALDKDGRVQVQADSDAQLTRGLVAMLVRGFEGAAPSQVLSADPRFIAASGLAVALTPARNNGFANALALVKKKVRELMNEQKVEISARKGHEESGFAEDEDSDRPTYKAILKKLAVLEPIKLNIKDESEQHATHAAMRHRKKETHFAIDVVSDKFESLGLVQRHRLVYTLLADEMIPGKVHALRINARTTAEES